VAEESQEEEVQDEEEEDQEEVQNEEEENQEEMEQVFDQRFMRIRRRKIPYRFRRDLLFLNPRCLDKSHVIYISKT